MVNRGANSHNILPRIEAMCGAGQEVNSKDPQSALPSYSKCSAMVCAYLWLSEKSGFKSNWISTCVLNLCKDERALTLILYVDDILVLWRVLADVGWLIVKLNEEFEGSLTHKTSQAFIYLRMFIKIDEEGKYSICMEDYQRNTVLSYA